jgi:hypothetical protein
VRPSDDGKEGGYVLSEEKAEGNCLYLDEVLHQQRQQEILFTD